MHDICRQFMLQLYARFFSCNVFKGLVMAKPDDINTNYCNTIMTIFTKIVFFLARS